MFELVIDADPEAQIEWFMNGLSLGPPGTARKLWALERGQHVAQARVHLGGGQSEWTDEVSFLVK